MSLRWLRLRWLTLALPVVAAMLAASSAQASPYIYSFSRVCENGYSPQCTDDYRSGNPATSSVSDGASYVPSDGSGGYNYSASSSGAAVFNNFSLFAQAGGGTFGPSTATGGGVGQFGMSASTQVQYHDEVTVAGTGTGKIVVPWHISGIFTPTATSGGPYVAQGFVGVSFCQSIKTGFSSGGLGCAGGGTQIFEISTSYDMIFNLEYLIEFGVDTSLNTTFVLGVNSGAGLASGIVADFTHTGLMQPARVYDSAGNLLPNALISANSGLDYSDPQAAGPEDPDPVDVPEPASFTLLGAGLMGLGLLRRRRARAAGPA